MILEVGLGIVPVITPTQTQGVAEGTCAESAWWDIFTKLDCLLTYGRDAGAEQARQFPTPPMPTTPPTPPDVTIYPSGSYSAGDPSNPQGEITDLLKASQAKYTAQQQAFFTAIDEQNKAKCAAYQTYDASTGQCSFIGGTVFWALIFGGAALLLLGSKR